MSRQLNNFVDLHHIEPISLRAPAFANSAQSVTFKHAISTTFSLPCEAQASPAPIYRYTVQILDFGF